MRAVIILNPYCKQPEVIPNKPKNPDFKIKQGESWSAAAHRMWYE